MHRRQVIQVGLLSLVPWARLSAAESPATGRAKTTLSTSAKAVNDVGQVVGWAIRRPGEYRAVVWTDGEMIDLGTLPGHTWSIAWGINDVGQVVGESRDSEGYARAVVWDRGQIAELSTIAEDSISFAFGINDAGQIAGVSGGYPTLHAVMWEEGVVSDLGTLPGAAMSEALAINQAGQIVGWSGPSFREQHACLWEDGEIIELPGISGAGFKSNAESRANAINDSGDIVGRASTPASPQAVVWRAGATVPLGALVDGSESEAMAINNSGQVAGTSYVGDSFGDGEHAVRWDDDDVVDLGALPGHKMSEATGIHDSGYVVGSSGGVLDGPLEIERAVRWDIDGEIRKLDQAGSHDASA